MTRFARREAPWEVMETQNWRAELKVVVADARRELIPRGAPASRLPAAGSGAHLRICLGKLDSRLTCSLVASPLSADSSSLSLPPRCSLPFGVSTLRRSPRREISRLSLAPGTFRREFAPIVASRHCGDQELDLCRQS